MSKASKYFRTQSVKRSREAMKLSKFFPSIIVLLTLDLTWGKVEIIQKSSTIDEKLREIIVKFFAMKASNIRIITFRKNDYNVQLMSSKFLSTFELIEASTLKNLPLLPSIINVIFLISMEEFELFLKNLDSKKFALNGYFLLVSNCSTINEGNIFKAAWLRYIVNINILCRDNDKTSIKTFIPFNENSCGNTTSITLDQSDEFFPEKLTNLYGCPIKLATFFYPPITMRQTLDNGTFRYYGSEMELAFGLASALNFTINMTYIAQSGFTGLLYENGTATGILKETIDGEKDMLMGFYYLTLHRTQFMSFTQSHYSIPLIVMIPMGSPLSPFEKLFRPFQNMVWAFLLVTFGSGAIVIAIINCQGRKVISFVFGERVHNPYLNMINVFVGGSLHVLPRRNFARSLLMMFMLFCLVQRSIYQGSLYIFLQSDGRNPEVATIDEMIEKNFVFYIRETLEHNIKHMNFYNR